MSDKITLAASSATDRRKLPTQVVDAHHHFLDTRGTDFQTWLRRCLNNTDDPSSDHHQYLPDSYQSDVIDPLQQAGIQLIGSVHVECMPDDGYREAAWVQDLMVSSSCSVKSIVASVDLGLETDMVRQQLKQLREMTPRVAGIRWILDCVTEQYEPNTATHVAVQRNQQRHGVIDYLRFSTTSASTVWPRFEAGLALLASAADHDGDSNNAPPYSFDLQCAPEQLPAAADLVRHHPNVPVIIDHLGKPRDIVMDDDASSCNEGSGEITTSLNEDELTTWRNGLQAMAELPNVYIKISMLGYIIPGWCASSAKQAIMGDLVREVVDLFGPSRCMMALNWWVNTGLSDSDGASDVGPSPVEYVTCLSEWLCDYSDEERHAIFCGTAQKVYRIATL